MKRITYISLLSGLLLITAGCDTFLDEDPDNRVDLDNLEKAGQLLVSAYSVSSPNFTDWLSDDVIFTVGTNIRLEHQEMFEWQDVSVGPTSLDTPIYYWFETYTAIAHANEVLAELDNLPANSDEAQARKRAVESEALLARAYGHFMLVNMFSQHYTGDNGSMAGVPYITTPETVFLAEYERESLGRVYDLIEEDLLRGIELVDDSFFENSGKY
ncbi:MAG: RagB/SusD family nutrient uptake outer membrane protein, partial [Bacteroidota bacterium]